ncbi:hypothetical protein SAMN05880501_10567 [Ureibacillus xyleni]|uniref:Uncharacterized protein n=1 Tax=Ureibacillus xyleni TaxID=614648 RepID=A0A285SKJ5_9BACL|nr:hypothetical protein [Ureibacillus xyleni]SOC08360.1 hypothetical protein SAMN05880501_10567 [Ureibacillus xyleni]
MKIAIYYQKSENEIAEMAINHINELIQLLETHHTVKGVFIDRYNESIELMELLNSPLSEIDYIYINKPIENDFDRALIQQLLRTEHFKIKYFNEI